MRSLWLFFWVKIQKMLEELRVRRLFHSKARFRLVDRALARSYYFSNPYRQCRLFWEKRGVKEASLYGETPLVIWQKIVEECGLNADDTVVDLGSGRGRGVFFLTEWVGCHAHGVERVDAFVEKARAVAERFNCKRASFSCEEMHQTDLSRSTAVYLYGTCMEDAAIEELITSFQQLKSGTKIITVSFPLTDYSDSFMLQKRFNCRYPWGEAEVYLQVKR